jgi:hypothetical protein
MQQQLIVKMVLDNWNSAIARTSKLIGELTDEQLEAECAPGRNTGKYLLGHLTAVHDRMLPLLGLGKQEYAHLNDAFLASPDKSGKEMPTVAELRHYWHDTNMRLDNLFGNLTAEDWFARHMSVSEEDFEKEPHRNRLNVILSRTGHLTEHLGQMLYLKK